MTIESYSLNDNGNWYECSPTPARPVSLTRPRVPWGWPRSCPAGVLHSAALLLLLQARGGQGGHGHAAAERRPTLRRRRHHPLSDYTSWPQATVMITALRGDLCPPPLLCVPGAVRCSTLYTRLLRSTIITIIVLGRSCLVFCAPRALCRALGRKREIATPVVRCARPAKVPGEHL